MRNAGQVLAAVLLASAMSEGRSRRLRNQSGGMKSDEARRLMEFEEEHKGLQECEAEQDTPTQKNRSTLRDGVR